MGKPNFNQPGKELITINGTSYTLVVYVDPSSGGYCGSVQEADGSIVTHSLLSFKDCSDCWAWVLGSLQNVVRGTHR